MIINLISRDILALEYNSRVEMNRQLYRITEHKEGPDSLKDNRFTFDDFLDAYLDDKGILSYFEYWEGHNFSMRDLLNFIYKFSGEMTAVEKDVYDLSGALDDDGYIIAYVQGDDVTKRHELAHAFYYTDLVYTNGVLAIMDAMPKDIKEKLHLALLDMNYNDSVVEDEMHAYIVAYDKQEWESTFGDIDFSRLDYVKAELDRLFKSHYDVIIKSL